MSAQVHHFVAHVLQAEDAAPGDIVHIGEAPGLGPVPVEQDRLALRDPFDEAVDRHVGTSRGTVDGEEAEDGNIDVVKIVIGVALGLRALFAGGIRLQRTVGGSALIRREGSVFAVDAGGGGLDELLHPVAAAAFQQVEGPAGIDIEVEPGILHAQPHARDPGDIDDCVEAVFGEKLLKRFKVGDIVSFGSYPQTRVTDNATIEALNKQSATWRSHGYYSGTKTEYSTTYDGKMTASDYMKYCDVTYGGKTYRGVRFSQFRPSYTDYPGNLSSQSINGYYTNTTYWFRWEPLYWRVLDPNTGLVLSEQIIDSQPYNNYMLSSGKDEYDRNAVWGDAKKTYYANNYAHSSLRSWLTDTANPTSFLNVAFTQTQRNALLQTTLDNSAYSKSYSAYDSASTTDTVFLLAYKDMLNTAYGFRSNDDDPNRQASGSDYAQCQGLHYGSTSEWWLRSAGRYSYTAGITASYGGLYLSMNANKTDVGVRPAVRMDLRSATPVTVTGIAIKSLPQKTAYVVGDDSFSQTGLTVTATYSDGSSRVTASGLVCTGFNTTTAGTKTITVTYHNKTATFTVTVESKPTITIRNYTASKTVDYRTTITFEAEVKPEVSGACIYWFIDGKEDEAGVTDLSFDYKTVEEAKKSFTIQAKYMKDGKVLAESEVETVKVKSGIFARLIAFFRALFGLLPKVTQDYLGVEIINRVLPD